MPRLLNEKQREVLLLVAEGRPLYGIDATDPNYERKIAGRMATLEALYRRGLTSRPMRHGLLSLILTAEGERMVESTRRLLAERAA